MRINIEVISDNVRLSIKYCYCFRVIHRTDAITLSKSASAIIGANNSSANSREQHPVRRGRTNRIFASLFSRSSRCWRCRIRASTALFLARDITWKPLVVSAISAIYERYYSIIAFLIVNSDVLRTHYRLQLLCSSYAHTRVYAYLFSFYLPGRHSANVSKMHNSISSSCSFAIAVRVAIMQAEALSLLVAPCLRTFIKSIGHVAARKTKRPDHPRRRILFCSSISRIEKSRWRRALRIAARNICADISYCIAVPAFNIRSNQLNYRKKNIYIYISQEQNVAVVRFYRRLDNLNISGKKITGRYNPSRLRMARHDGRENIFSGFGLA